MYRKIAIPTVLLALLLVALPMTQAQTQTENTQTQTGLPVPTPSVNDAFLVSWPAIPDIGGYNMQYRMGAMDWTNMQLTFQFATSSNFGRTPEGYRKPAGDYQVRVRTFKDSAVSAWSKTVSFTIPLHKHPTPRISKSAMKVSWDRIPSASAYDLRYRIANGKWFSFNLPGTWVNSFTFTKTQKDVDYHVQVRVSQNGQTDASDWSNTIIMRDSTLQKLPGATNLSNVGLVISWDAVPNAVAYSVTIKGGATPIPVTRVTEATITIPGGQYGQTYIIIIQTHGDGTAYETNGHYSTPWSVTPQQPPPPPAPKQDPAPAPDPQPEPDPEPDPQPQPPPKQPKQPSGGDDDDDDDEEEEPKKPQQPRQPPPEPTQPPAPVCQSSTKCTASSGTWTTSFVTNKVGIAGSFCVGTIVTRTLQQFTCTEVCSGKVTSKPTRIISESRNGGARVAC